MYQVTFSEQSMHEINQLETADQLKLIESLSRLTEDDFKQNSKTLGKFQRQGKTFYRLRAKDHRIYFEIKEDDIIYSHYILPQHSWSDFIIRFKLPISEEHLIEKDQSFWKYLDNLNK